MKSHGLLAATPVKWLIGKETEIHQAIVAFLEGRGDDWVDAAGPPTMTELILYRANPKLHRLKLPTVRLRFVKVEYPLTGESGVEVKCSPEELEMIESWRVQAEARKALAASAPRDMAEREHW